jgi:CRISPR-associated protein Csx17
LAQFGVLYYILPADNLSRVVNAVVNNLNRLVGRDPVSSSQEYPLGGIKVQPLGNYLAGLGLLRLVNRTIDPQAKGCWRGGAFWLQTQIEQDDLVPRLVDSYVALHIVNPWNKATEISVEGKTATFSGQFGALQKSPCVRLKGLSALLEEVLQVMAEQPTGNQDDKSRQVDALKRQIANPEWVEWCESAIVEVQETDKKGTVSDRLKYPALLGTGGNVGNTDLAVNYYQALGLVFDLDSAEGTPDEQAIAMFTEAIFGGSTQKATHSEDCKGAHLFPVNDFYLDFKKSNSLDYVASGGDGGAALNPALVLLATEGFLTFSSTISTINSLIEADRVGIRAKSQVAKYSLAVPTKGSSSNLVSISERQKYTEEYFLPLWSAALTHANLKAKLFESPLVTEVGFSLRHRPNDGTDFINEVRAWAARTGATGQLLRYQMLPRKGQGNFAVYMGVVEVGGDVIDLAADMNPVRNKLKSAAENLPATVSAMIYQFDRRYAEFCENGRDSMTLLHLLGKISRHPDVDWCFKSLKLRGDWLAGHEDAVELRLAVSLGLAGSDRLNPASAIASMVALLKDRSRAKDTGPRDRRLPASLADIDQFIRGDLDFERFVLWTEILKYVSTSEIKFEPRSTVVARLPVDYRLGLTYIAEFGYENCTFAPHCVQRLMGQGIYARSGDRPSRYADSTLAALLFPVSWEDQQIVLKQHFLLS